MPARRIEDLTPDDEHFHDATGNEGASFERTYSRASLVLWPRARRLAVLNQAGLGTTLPHLEDLTARWAASGIGTESSLWREADELSGHMLRSWPRQTWRRDSDPNVGRMLDAQVRLGNAAGVEAFLADVSAEGHYAASDNEAIVRGATLLPRARATDLLVRIVRRNAAAHLSVCGDLALRCVAASSGSAGDAAQIGAALIDILPGDPARPVDHENRARPSPVEPGFLVDLLTVTSRIDAALAARAIGHVLSWPRTYGSDDVLVPAALTVARRTEGAPWPAVRRLRGAALDHVRRRITLTLEAPRDWTRTNSLTFRCDNCCTLGAFLVDPAQWQWRLKAAQDQQSIRTAGCDLDVTTEKRGSPHTLVATKNQASYERRMVQRRQDLQRVSALGG